VASGGTIRGAYLESVLQTAPAEHPDLNNASDEDWLAPFSFRKAFQPVNNDGQPQRWGL
jgi:hypothetical protein